MYIYLHIYAGVSLSRPNFTYSYAEVLEWEKISMLANGSYSCQVVSLSDVVLNRSSSFRVRGRCIHMSRLISVMNTLYLQCLSCQTSIHYQHEQAERAGGAGQRDGTVLRCRRTASAQSAMDQSTKPSASYSFMFC